MIDTIKYDCFAYRCKKNKNTGMEENKCDALDDLYCKRQEKCEFYQNKEAFEERKSLLLKRKVN